jgi:hypothetical protein
MSGQVTRVRSRAHSVTGRHGRVWRPAARWAAVAAALAGLFFAFLGPLPATAVTGTPFTVKATLDARYLPSLISAIIPDRYAAGSTIYVVCQELGAEAYGSSIWDKTSEGYYVPDRWVATGTTTWAPNVPRCSGSGLVYGTPYKVTATLDGRYTPQTTAARVVDKYPNGSTIYVLCQTPGDAIYGSAIWDKTTDGLYVPDYYVSTGSAGYVPGLPRCDSGSSPNPFNGTYFRAKATLDGRYEPTLTSTRLVDYYSAGATLLVTCQTLGEEIYGSQIWDKTIEGLFVPDYYVDTNTTDFVPGVPRCGWDRMPGVRGTPFRAKATLDGRVAPTLVSNRVTDKYPLNSTIYVVCQTIGDSIYGSSIWDLTSDDLYVPDHYVDTDTISWAPGVPRCDTTGTPTDPTGSEDAERQAIVARATAALTTSRKYQTVQGGTIYNSIPGVPNANINYLGRNGSNSNRNEYNNYNGEPWCGYFARAMWNGSKETPLHYPSSQAWMNEANHFHGYSASDLPKPGDVLVWTNIGDPGHGHVGVVVGVSGTTVTTIEGNNGYPVGDPDSIFRNTYSWTGYGPALSGKTFRGFASRY